VSCRHAPRPVDEVILPASERVTGGTGSRPIALLPQRSAPSSEVKLGTAGGPAKRAHPEPPRPRPRGPEAPVGAPCPRCGQPSALCRGERSRQTIEIFPKDRVVAAIQRSGDAGQE